MMSLDYNDTIIAVAGEQDETIIEEALQQYDGQFTWQLRVVRHLMKMAYLASSYTAVHEDIMSRQSIISSVISGWR